MSNLEELLAVQALAQGRFAEAKTALDSASRAVLEERFRDVERFAEGDVILVRRKLFGKYRWWPARVAAVRLQYMHGKDASGAPWESKHISYSVFLQQKDGEFGGSSEGFYHHETARMPEPAEAAEPAS